MEEDDAPDGFEPAQIGNDYLLNAHRKGDRHYRLILKPGDAETLLALIHRRPLPAGPAKRILEAFAFFKKRIVQLGPDVSALCAGLRKLRIVAFDLKGGEDNPHRVFETMNARGRDLGCADMIGNLILMPLDRERQELLYTVLETEPSRVRGASRASDSRVLYDIAYPPMAIGPRTPSIKYPADAGPSGSGGTGAEIGLGVRVSRP